MIRSRTGVVSVPVLAAFLAGVTGFAIYTRTSMASFAEGHGTSLTFWEVVLGQMASGYALSYLVVPVACWCILRQVGGSAGPEQLIRHATRTDWAFAQGYRALPWIVGLTATWLGVACTAASAKTFTWTWGEAARSPEVVLQLPELTPDLPLPVLAVALQVVALVATLVALTVVTAGVAARSERPRRTAVTAVVLVLWSIISFRTSGWFADVFGVATYALPWRSTRALSIGPWGGLAAILVAGSLAYAAVRAVELRRARRSDVPVLVVTAATAPAVLLALASTVPVGDDEQVARLLLQGVAADGMSLLHYGASLILVLVPAVVLHRDFVASITRRRYPEMIRTRSPARWYLRRSTAGILFCGAYGLSCAAWAALLVGVRAGTVPGLSSIRLTALWGAALAVQVLVVTSALALVTVAGRRIESGAYAIGALALLALPLGPMSRWMPVGQASAARMTELAPSPSDIHLVPLITLAGWLAVLSAATAVLINRTRGDVH